MSRSHLPRALFAAACLIGALFASASPALAYDETTSTIPPQRSEENCGGCHQPYFTVGTGVHGSYTTTTSKCRMCHTVHFAPADGVLLLPASTVQGTCFTCHDGTGGKGVYGAIAARGLSVGGTHRTETTSTVPGGDPSTGGSAVESFRGQGGTMTCTDCHSPHGSEIVTAFPGDRRRVSEEGYPPLTLTRMLRQRPGEATQAVAEYGSDWCLACHRGRSSALSTTHNHPAESAATTSNPYVYRSAAILATDAPTSAVVIGAVGQTNRGYLMPYPRPSLMQGRYPICQQCHEDTRYVGELVSNGTQGDAATWTVSQADGTVSTDNPRFQNFPHETTGYRLLVEATTTAYTDDLCLNCHPLEQLP
ncbi:hypothetical protein MX659_01365 [Coriobacteriia bacterium Es71-Z0120]|uniref:cytochrome c3 family protein n=1 Tax=Parvivirga hydrogeniphila TaxID=2939460 RepID=UPI002260C30D|nr:cytochrome c3 family protein [Parvivirga hydrogeniphila]MCL4078261.1 hypothetical protein [Parvivirga hydrogeniphila]